MKNIPFVSVIIPCRNESKFIEKCLNSILNNDYPKNRMEILVIDGMSEDKTREIINKYSQEYYFVNLLDNQKRIAPSAMNIGIKKAKGDVVIRMDAHNRYEKNYISKCVKYLQKYKADNVGGIWITLPGENTSVARAIALALTHPFGVGNAYFRRGVNEVKEVDTVPFGCYKKKVFKEIGLFNENLIRNQDIEFNLRLKRAGGKILLCPDIVSYYYARPNLSSLFKQNFGNGFWVIYSTKYAELPFSFRHLVPFVFILFLLFDSTISLFYKGFFYLLLGVLILYIVLDITYSLSLSIKHNLKYFPFLIITFPTLHFPYGLGSLYGIVKLTLSKLGGK